MKLHRTRAKPFAAALMSLGALTLLLVLNPQPPTPSVTQPAKLSPAAAWRSETETKPPAETPKSLAASDWSSIRQVYERNRRAAVTVGNERRARNYGQQWLTRFDGRGFAVEPDGASWRWGLELQSYGFPGHERAVNGRAQVGSEGERVTYDWDAELQEWFVNDRRGLEHGFTLKRRPAGAGERLALRLAVRGGLRPRVSADGRGVSFADAQGCAVVNYAGLEVYDADGRALAARFAAEDDALRLTVDEGGARYPITIDPIAQQAYLKASNTGTNDVFGGEVAISGDTVVVTADQEASNATGVNGNEADNSTANSGAAYVFVRSGTTWSQQAYLKASNTGAGDEFGQSIAISGDTVVVGAWQEDSNATGVNGNQANNSAQDSGAAYVFVRNGTTWSQQAYLKASNTEASDFFGISVAIFGETVVVGAHRDDSNATGVNGNQTNNSAQESGAAYVFLRSGTVWSQQAYLKASNTGAGDLFGISVAISGETVVVGAVFEASNATGINGDQTNNSTALAGAAYVFLRSGTVWSQQAYLKASNTEAGDQFGYSVAISGETVVVGAIEEDSNTTGVNGNQADNSADASGAAYVFVRSGTTWSQQAYLKASNTGAGDGIGYNLAVSGDTIVLGAGGEDSNATGVNGDQTNNSADGAGAAYVFMRSGTTWSQQAYLKASNPGQFDGFGSVAVSGETVIVGAGGEDSSATGVNGDQTNNSVFNSGAVYIFPITIDSIAQQAYLKASNTEAEDRFGRSVAVSNDTVVVGAYQEDSNATGVNGNQADNSATDSGAAYVFVRSGTTWSQQAYLKASNTGAGDQFGLSLAMAGDTVVVGAWQEDSNATGVNGNQANNSADAAGAAYVFVRSGTTWSQQAYLKASNSGANDQFGFSVAVVGDTVVAGAWREDSDATGVNGSQANNNAFDSGAAYVFVRNGTAWTQQAYLKASNTGVDDLFGLSVAVSGDTVVVGAEGEGSNTTGVNGDQTNNSAFAAGAAYVFVRSGTVWSQQAYLKASNTGAGDQFGRSVAVAGDTVVVGAVNEDSNATGVNGNQANNSAFDSGAAYVFVRSGTTWSQQAYLKASNTGAFDSFGWSAAVAGDTVVVGAYNESSNATGVNGNQADNSATSSGAAYVFVRNSTIWSQHAYLKASNTRIEDRFGISVAIAGGTMVVGADLENSNAVGVNGDQANNSAGNAGAAYVFLNTACPTITLSPSTLPNSVVGVAYSVLLTASGGTGPYTFSASAGALPPGLTLNPSSGLLSDTPIQAGTFNLTIQATDASACTGTRAYSLIVSSECPTVTGIAPTAGAVGAQVVIIGTNFTGVNAVRFSNNITANFTVDSATQITATVPAGAVIGPITISRTGCADVMTPTFTVTGACHTVTNINPTSGVIGAQVVITGTNFTGVDAVRFSNNVTAMFTVNSATQITTTVPAGAVTGPITISKTSCTDVTTATFTITAPPACPTVTNLNPTSGIVGSQVVIAGTNFTGTTAVKFSNNVNGSFTVNSDTQITATVPPGATTGPITLVKTGCPDTQTGTFTLCSTITLSPSTLPNGTVGVAYPATTLTASGGTGPYTFSASGNLPPGMTLSAGGTLSSTPTQAGSFNFTVQATDVNSCTGTRQYTLTVSGAITVNTTADENGTNAAACSLREAITAANTNAAFGGCTAGATGIDSIQFNLGTGTPTINVTSALPDITEALTIDGATGGATRIQLNGAGAGANANGLTVSGGGSTIRGLVINRFNQNGIFIDASNGNTIQNCYLGTDVTGTLDLGNAGSGVYVEAASNNTIGGPVATTRNLISGNNAAGVALFLAANNNAVLGNFIGTDVSGALDLGNGVEGVAINNSANNVIGTGNVISGNDLGVQIIGAGSSGNQVQGNFIGLNAAGTAAVGNSREGVVLDGAPGNIIGGTAAGARNVISGNLFGGVLISNAAAVNNQVLGNYIGTNAAGTGLIGNADGVVVLNASNTMIGGTVAGAGNLIAGNVQTGVLVIGATATGNRALGNLIFSNGARGLALTFSFPPGGVTANDAGDADSGPNNLQNFPVINSVSNAGALGGTLDSTAVASAYPLRIEFFANTACDPSGNGEGELLLGFSSLAAPGAFTFNFTPVVGKPFITATATDNNGNTSEFSACRTVGDVPPQTITVNTTADTTAADGSCSLREAILSANGAPANADCVAGAAGLDTIEFNLGASTPTINVLTALPDITERVTIDGATGGATRVQLNGGGLGTNVAGLIISAGNSTVRALVVNRFTGAGMQLTTLGGNTIQNCLIGLNAAGLAALPNARGGIVVTSANNLIGGTAAGVRNVIAGNTLNGVEINGANATGNQVLGNFIGTDVNGALDLGNTLNGVILDGAPGNVVGGATTEARNLISGNNSCGVNIRMASATGNLVLGNFIGTKINGTEPLANTNSGVCINGASGNVVGGTAAGARNLISGNGNDGVQINDAGATSNRLEGNLIGTGVTGNTALGNGRYGVQIFNAPNNTIGGTDTGARNVISGNGNANVFLNGAEATGNQMLGNFIGPNANGTGALNPKANGVDINNAVNNLIGGAAAGARNIISGNAIGVSLDSTSDNQVLGNFIGTNANGTAVLPNGTGVERKGTGTGNNIGGTEPGAGNVISGNTSAGIQLQGRDDNVLGNLIGTNAAGTAALGNLIGVSLNVAAADSNTIGGAAVGARNVISGNIGDGVIISGGAIANRVLGNFIGVNRDNTAALPNAGHGVNIDSGGRDNIVGGEAAGAENVIANNGGIGVRVFSATSTGNRVLRNRIFNNGGAAGALGIDLGTPGVTANDDGDGDAGPNGLQNFPILTAVSVIAAGANSTTTFQGTLNSTPSTRFRIEFFANPACDASGNGEGRTFLGFTNITTDSGGNANIRVTLPTPPTPAGNAITAGDFVTTTATNRSNGNTSEFSPCVCSFGFTPPTAAFTRFAATGSFALATAPICNWTATVPAGSFITITGGGSGTGNGTVSYALSENTGPRLRTGTIEVRGPNVAGQPALPNLVIITQTGTTGTVIFEDFAVGNLTFLPGSNWTITDGGTGNYQDQNNSSAAWTNLNPCGRNIVGGGFTPNFAIMDASCISDSNSTLDEFLFTPPFNATGLGMVVVEFINQFHWNSAAPNNIGDVDVSINGGMTWTNVRRFQGGDVGVPMPNTESIDITAAVTANPANVLVRMHYYGVSAPLMTRPSAPSGEQFAFWAVDFTICGFGISPMNASSPPSGGSGTVAVTAPNPPAPTAWTAVSNVPWITNVMPASGNGNGTVSYSVLANPNQTPRTGTMTIAGITFTVTQPGFCAGVTVNPATANNGFVGVPYSQTFTASGGTSPYTFSANGTLPPGLTLSATGTLSGMPTTGGLFTFTIIAADAGNCGNSRQYTVSIGGGNGLQFYPLPRPLRLLDTRADQSLCDNIGTPITGGTTLTTQARITCNGLTIPANAQAIVGNVTAINQTASFGFLTLFPAGQTLPLAANIIYEPGQLLSNNFTVGLNANGEFSTFAERTLHTVIDVSGYFAPPTPSGLFYHALPRPLRLLDTRPDQSLCDNVGLPITGGTALTTQARISCNGLTIPTAAQAIVGNATVINQTASFGFMTLFPAGQTLPLAANMIYAPNQLLANYFTVGLSAGGAFDTFAERTLHLVIDVAGYYSTEANDANGLGLLFNPLPQPLRLLDTRADQSLCDNVGLPIAAGTSLTTQARITCNGITIPTSAQAVSGNITVINQTASFGFMTLFPAGQTLPLAANMIYAPGQLLANAFVVGLSGLGEFNTFGERTIHVVIDVSGYFAP